MNDRWDNGKEIIKTAIYIRVSDDKRKSDGERRQDIERQKNVIINFLNNKGINKFEIYADDGKSAFTEDINQRPEFKRLFSDCIRNFVREIYVEDMTRFSRSVSLGLQWIKQLGELGVQIISLKEGEIEVTSSKGWMQSTMLLMFAEWDSRVKSEKVKSGMQKSKKICLSCGIVHFGRHPKKCKCEICLSKKGKNLPTLSIINGGIN